MRSEQMQSSELSDLKSQIEDAEQFVEPVGYDFGFTRRSFVQMLGAGILICTAAGSAIAQTRPSDGEGAARGRGGRGGTGSRPVPLDARLHIAKDGTITVMTGKVEGGQGSRAELTQAAAEELRVPVDRVRLIMADTSLCPDDGITAGSGTTPRTMPAIRQACAAARALLAQVAQKQWNLPAESINVSNGAAVDATTQPSRSFAYADLAAADTASDAFKQSVPRDALVTAVKEWKVM